MNREQARARCDEIDATIEEAKGWGSWMVEYANEREALANQFNFEQRYNARCGNQRTD